MNKVIIVLVILSFNGMLIAQNEAYSIFYCSGNAELVNHGKSTLIKKGDAIENNSVLSIPKNSYVVIINNENIPLGIDKAGEYKTSDINSLYNILLEQNITEEFFKYIAGNMIREKEIERKASGVYRYVGHPIMKYPFDSAYILTPEIDFVWNSSDKYSLFLKIFDKEWNLILDMESKDSTYTVNISELGLENGKTYYWVISPFEGMPANGTECLVFSVCENSFIQEFQFKISQIENEQQTEDMRKFLKLMLYLENNIYPVPKYFDL
ncbi:MAG TPA: hypothetical protein PLO05_04115 [Bacteroidales bacterium]|nr:hypothetical protein [Bacteroidales bacterium]MDD4236119.1 hypothetical protein [Bacteroidales bacterium]HXK81325.1 hypothetical protein [Bacteroidales bacterium]